MEGCARYASILPSTGLLTWMHERNTIKLHPQMNTWMFVICRTHYSYEKCAFRWFFLHRIKLSDAETSRLRGIFNSWKILKLTLNTSSLVTNILLVSFCFSLQHCRQKKYLLKYAGFSAYILVIWSTTIYFLFESTLEYVCFRHHLHEQITFPVKL